MDENAARKLVLEELERAFQRKYAASDILDGKLQSTLNYSSIIVAIGSGVLAAVVRGGIGLIFWIDLFVVLVLYLFTFRVIINGLNPRKFVSPISNSWDELSKRYFHSPETQVLDLFISEHLTAMNLADEINGKKAKAVRDSSGLMFCIVILLLLAVPLGLLIPV